MFLVFSDFLGPSCLTCFSFEVLCVERPVAHGPLAQMESCSMGLAVDCATGRPAGHAFLKAVECADCEGAAMLASVLLWPSEEHSGRHQLWQQELKRLPCDQH